MSFLICCGLFLFCCKLFLICCEFFKLLWIVFVLLLAKWATVHYDEEDTLLAFPLYLEGSALRYYETLTERFTKDYNRLKDSFKERYSPQKLRVYKRMQLYWRRMKPTEPLADYTLYILDESRKLELTDVEKMKIFYPMTHGYT